MVIVVTEGPLGRKDVKILDITSGLYAQHTRKRGSVRRGRQ